MEDYLFSVIGKLYVDNLSFQKMIPQLNSSLAAKDNEIGELKKMLQEMNLEPQWTTQKENV